MADEKQCLAPVFDRSTVCALLVPLWVIALVFLVLLAALFPSLWCKVKQMVFRIKNCSLGNDDPNIPL